MPTAAISLAHSEPAAGACLSSQPGLEARQTWKRKMLLCSQRKENGRFGGRKAKVPRHGGLIHKTGEITSKIKHGDILQGVKWNYLNSAGYHKGPEKGSYIGMKTGSSNETLQQFLF